MYKLNRGISKAESPSARYRSRFPVILLLLLLGCYQVLTAQTIREKRVTIRYNYESLSNCLKQLQAKSGVSISFNENDVAKYTINDLNFQETSVEQIITKLLQNTSLQFREVNNGLVIFSRTSSVVKTQQTKKIKGAVTGEDGSPIAGASVQIKGSFKGVYTSNNGQFEISVPEGKGMLHISSAGYEGKDVPALDTLLSVILKKDNKQLESVVVVGYGQVNKKDVTGSVSSMKGDELNKMNSSNFDAMLTGRAAGVHVVKSSGAPGAVASIRIRGGTSAVGNNEPLYVIDGIPIELGDGFGNAAYQTDSRNKISPLASINSEDIESIDILKDASATAIYGSRGANGVVIVTTKRGKKGDKPNITFDVNSSADKFVKQYTMLNAEQYHNVVKSAYTTLPNTFIAYPNVPDANTNWVDEIIRTSFSNNVYLNINGGSPTGNTLYSFSGGLTKQEGPIRNTDFSRQNLKASLETTLFDKLRFGTNINFSLNENNGRSIGQYYLIARYRPDVPVYDPKGNYGASPDSVTSNPVARMRQPSRVKSQVVMTSFFGEVELIRGLLFRSTFSATSTKGTNEDYTPSTDVFEIRNKRKGSRTDYINSGSSRIFDNTLTYNQRFGDHSINAVAGASWSLTKSTFTNLNTTSFVDDEVLNDIGSANTMQTFTSGGAISGLASYFLRANYNYAGKYYVTFTGRADHSTKFSPVNRWGYFPSGALAWRISREDFMLGSKLFNDLKLRVSYGKTGSANFADFQYSTFFKSGNYYGGNNAVAVNTIPNPDIKWEGTYQLDAALDFNMLNNKLRGTLGYFRKVTHDLILDREIIRETGGRTQPANLGDFLNQGWEFQIGSDVVNNNKFAYLIDVNITRYRSKVLKLNSGSYLNMKEGQPIGHFTGWKVAGIFQSQAEIDALNAKAPGGKYQSDKTSPGDFKFVDVNGDGIINDADEGILGKSEPDLYGGWNNIFRYKNLEISALFNFSLGNRVDNSGYKSMVVFANNNNNYSDLILGAWTPNNPGAKLPRVVANDPNRNNRNSDYFIENASFFKLKNIQASYLLRNNLLRRVFVSGIRIYASVSNVFVFTKYKGLDPEVNTAPSNNFSQGIDSNVYPLTRTFTFGFTANF